MSSSAEKARVQRLERLQASLYLRLENPDAALEMLISELKIGELHPDFWQELHSAAARDGKVVELSRAYEKAAAGHRLRQLGPAQRASLLVQAADFFQGVVGDAAGAERFLWGVLEAVSDHADAYARLERGINATRDKVRLCELYALVAAKPPMPPDVLAREARDLISLLPSQSPLADEACRKLLVLSPVDQALVWVLETHCRQTGRFGLACELLEESIASSAVAKPEIIKRRHRLIELYIGDAKAPEKAISHVEQLLAQDASDAQALAAAERLLRIPQVSARTAAALLTARRRLRGLE